MEHLVAGFRVVVEEGEGEYFVVHVPDLKSCWSQGRTEKEALENIEEAISLHIEVLEERDEPVPDRIGEN